MKRQKCEPLRSHRFINLSSLWFVILISWVFAWPLGACGKDAEGKKSEARVRCWWIRAQNPSPQSLWNVPSVTLSRPVWGWRLWAPQATSLLPRADLALPRLALPRSGSSRSCFWPRSLLRSCLCGRGSFHPRGPRGCCTPRSREGQALRQPRLRENDLEG